MLQLRERVASCEAACEGASDGGSNGASDAMAAAGLPRLVAMAVSNNLMRSPSARSLALRVRVFAFVREHIF